MNSGLSLLNLLTIAAATIAYLKFNIKTYNFAPPAFLVAKSSVEPDA
jgi:hypothetical protein